MERQCPKCNCFVWQYGEHICPPRWYVWCPEDGETQEDSRPIYATNAEIAAILWAERSDCYGDYTILEGATPLVHVAPEHNLDDVHHYRVSGESVPTYTACEE